MILGFFRGLTEEDAERQLINGRATSRAWGGPVAVKEKTHRPGGFFSERSEEVELPAAGAKILKIILCTWKLVRGLNARQNPYQKNEDLPLSLSLLFSSFLPPFLSLLKSLLES